jgi:hypothetical protein
VRLVVTDVAGPRTVFAEIARLVDDAVDAERTRLPEPIRGPQILRLAELFEDAGDAVVPPHQLSHHGGNEF